MLCAYKVFRIDDDGLLLPSLMGFVSPCRDGRISLDGVNCRRDGWGPFSVYLSVVDALDLHSEILDSYTMGEPLSKPVVYRVGGKESQDRRLWAGQSVSDEDYTDCGVTFMDSYRILELIYK